METIMPYIGSAVLIVVFTIIGLSSRQYNARCEILDEQFNADMETTRHLMSLCTKVDAVKLIDKFYDRWHGIIPEWVICAHVMELRRYLDYEHKSPKDIIFNQPISKN